MNEKKASSVSSVAWATLTAVVFLFLFFDSKRVSGLSMEPTLYPGQVIYINKGAYGLRIPFLGTTTVLWSTPHRGDIVVFHSPREDITAVKRCLGIGGDNLIVKQNKLLVGSTILPINEDQRDFFSRFSRIPDDMIFVIGDNADNSIDSRDYGFIHVEKVMGKVILFPRKTEIPSEGFIAGDDGTTQ